MVVVLEIAVVALAENKLEGGDGGLVAQHTSWIKRKCGGVSARNRISIVVQITRNHCSVCFPSQRCECLGHDATPGTKSVWHRPVYRSIAVAVWYHWSTCNPDSLECEKWANIWDSIYSSECVVAVTTKVETLTESTQVAIALVFDGMETLALADTSRTIPRIEVCCAVTVDVLILGLACGSIFEIFLDDYQQADADTHPRVVLKEVAFFYIVAILCVLNISG